MPNLIIESQGRLVIVVHNRVPYNREEWQSLMALLRRPDLESLRLLGYDDGGGSSIDSAMRQEAIAAVSGRQTWAAIVTDCRITRGIITAIGWFKPGFRAFTPDQFEKAANHLGLTEDERAYATRTAARLMARVASNSA